MKRIIISCALAAALAMAAWCATPQEIVSRFAADTSLRHASVGVAVMDISSRQMVAASNADQAQVAASTFKTVTSAAALELLGANYQFATPVYLLGELKKDKFKGNILIMGAGDPTLGSRHFPSNPDIVAEITSALQALGVKKIEGDVVIDNSLYPTPFVNDWWNAGDLAWDYGASVQALNYHDNVVRLRFTSHDGEPANVQFTPPVPGLNFVQSTGNYSGTGTDFMLDYGTPGIVMLGAAQNRDYDVTLANPTPGAMLADSVRRALPLAGFKFKLKPQALDKVKQPSATLLVTHRSPQLAAIIRSLLDRSDNMFAEALLRAIALKQGHEARDSWGCAEVKRLWQQRGLDVSPLFMHDGSGLARIGKCSARFFVEMLSYMATRSYDGGTRLSDLMPPVGRRIGKLLPQSSIKDQIVVKSGSMTGVQCYVGYYPAQRPKYAFAVLANNYLCTRAQLRDGIDAMLIAIFASK